MNNKGKYLNRAFLNAELYGETLPRLPLVEMLGRCRVLIENHCGIDCYSEGEIRVNSRLGVIRISGDQLCLNKASKDSLIITGKIWCISLC